MPKGGIFSLKQPMLTISHWIFMYGQSVLLSVSSWCFFVFLFVLWGFSWVFSSFSEGVGEGWWGNKITSAI